MAFRKIASGVLAHPHVSYDLWLNFRDRARGRVKVASEKSANLIHRASEIFGHTFDPSKYLLSHATIVCSVDAMDVSGSKTGKIIVDGQRINRKWSDFRATPETYKFSNSNGDGWSREVIMGSYPTFVGSSNFVEHCQLSDFEKGKIIDAAVRDIGPSLYVDILLATDRKHDALVKAITNGKMSTLSMGASVLATICTRCGNVASDETDLCGHVRHLKGNKFFDQDGRQHKTIELCGHKSMDPNCGNNFIEASWVAGPAFGGAVLRNILEPTEIGVAITDPQRGDPNSLPPQWGGTLKAASESDPGMLAVAFNGFEDGEGEGGEPKEEKTPLDKAKDEVYEALVEDAKGRAIKEIRKREQEEAISKPEGELETSLNETINKQARTPRQDMYCAALAAFLKTSNSDAEFLDKLAQFNEGIGIDVPIPVYRVALLVGPRSVYASDQEFLGACRRAMGFSPHENLQPHVRNSLLRLGKLLNLRGRVGPEKSTRSPSDVPT